MCVRSIRGLRIEIKQVVCWLREVPGIQFQVCVLQRNILGGGLWFCHWLRGLLECRFFSLELHIKSRFLVQSGLSVLQPRPCVGCRVVLMIEGMCTE